MSYDISCKLCLFLWIKFFNGSILDVEDGHTLHLVVRQPIPPLSESSTSNAGLFPLVIASLKFCSHCNFAFAIDFRVILSQLVFLSG